MTINGEKIATTPGVSDTVTAGEMALHVAGFLPGLMNEHAKRIRRVVIEVA